MMEREQVGPSVPPLPSPPSRPSGMELGRLWRGWERSFVFGGGLSGYLDGVWRWGPFLQQGF